MRRRRQTARRSAAGCGSAAEGHRGRRRAGGRRRGGQSAKSVSSRLPVSRAMSIVCAEPTRSQQQCVQPELRRRAALQGSSHASPPRSARCRVSRESQSTSSDTAAHASSRRLSAAAAVALGIELARAGGARERPLLREHRVVRRLPRVLGAHARAAATPASETAAGCAATSISPRPSRAPGAEWSCSVRRWASREQPPVEEARQLQGVRGRCEAAARRPRAA